MPDLVLRFHFTFVCCGAPGWEDIDTSALIDEDVELQGHTFHHSRARAGVISRAEKAVDSARRTPLTQLPKRPVLI